MKIVSTDEGLLKRLRQGEVEAFEEIFSRFWEPLYHVASARLDSEEEAEEIVQDVFTNLWKDHDVLRIMDLRSYLFSSVKNGVISKIRTRLVHQKYQHHYLSVFPGYARTTEETIEFEELSHVLEDALQQLPEKSQQIFRLNRLLGRSIAEISETLKMPRRTIEHHLTISIRELRLRLKDYMLVLAVSLMLQ
jgi:RNA polymerase sigma-70 factor (ECF subfamily)